MNTTNHSQNDLPYRLGVGAMIFNDQNHVLVGKRIDNPGPAWQMPQGGIDAGEDPGIAVWREIEEEIGTVNCKIIAESKAWLTYDIPEELRATLWGGKYRGQKQKWYAMRFLGNDSEINLAAHHKPEFSEWKWAEISNIPDLIVSFKRDLYVQIVNEFSHIVLEGNK